MNCKMFLDSAGGGRLGRRELERLPLNEFLILCARCADEDAAHYAILANHYDFPAAYEAMKTPRTAVDEAKAAWERWYHRHDRDAPRGS